MTIFNRKLQDIARGNRRGEELIFAAVGKNVGKSAFHQDVEHAPEEDIELTIETAILKNLKGEEE
jgi:hypothetical protein